MFSYFFGFLLGAMFVGNDLLWSYSLWIQIFLVMATLLIFLFIPERYTDIKQAIDIRKEIEEQSKMTLGNPGDELLAQANKADQSQQPTT